MRLFFLITFLLVGCNTISSKEHIHEKEIVYGKITVPENRNDPNSRKINISYAFIPSKNTTNRPPIVFIQGGPGGSSLAMVPFFSSSPLNANHDIILFDARGTGKSGAYCTDLGNKFMDLMAKDLSSLEEYKATLEIANNCKQELADNDVDLAGYNSKENAADLEALRKELNIEKWILFGGSYGTRLGLTYLREYDGAEAAVFMGLFPPEVNIYEGFIPGLDAALNHLFKSCANDEKCNGKYPDLRNTFVTLIDDLRTTPKRVSYRGKDFVINAQDALMLIHQMLYQREFIQQIPLFIHKLKDGNSRVIASAIDRTALTLTFINIATYWSVQAYEEVQFNEKDALKKDLEKYSTLRPGPAFFASDQLVLEQWHSYRAEPIETKAVITNTPTLIVNGLFDPITPVQNARNLIKRLPNATLVEFKSEGHTLFNSCFFDLFEQFVANDYQAASSTCNDEGSIYWR